MGIWPQFRSPLHWDFVCLLCYILMSVMFWYVGLIPDLATMRDRATTRGSGSCTASWRWAGRDRRGIGGNTRHIRIMAAMMAPLVISVHSIVGLDFAGGLTPGWHATQFPPYFVFGAVLSGFALVLMLVIPMRRAYGLQGVITERHIDVLARLMLTTSLLISYA